MQSQSRLTSHRLIFAAFFAAVAFTSSSHGVAVTERALLAAGTLESTHSSITWSGTRADAVGHSAQDSEVPA